MRTAAESMRRRFAIKITRVRERMALIVRLGIKFAMAFNSRGTHSGDMQILRTHTHTLAAITLTLCEMRLTHFFALVLFCGKVHTLWSKKRTFGGDGERGGGGSSGFALSPPPLSQNECLPPWEHFSSPCCFQRRWSQMVFREICIFMCSPPDVQLGTQQKDFKLRDLLLPAPQEASWSFRKPKFACKIKGTVHLIFHWGWGETAKSPSHNA
jgi:hypothetical protein